MGILYDVTYPGAMQDHAVGWDYLQRLASDKANAGAVARARGGDPEYPGTVLVLLGGQWERRPDHVIESARKRLGQ